MTRAAERERAIRETVEKRGVSDTRVLDAMRTVERELFVPPEFRAAAYEDRPLPIGAGQTISQPYIVAFMAEALQLKGGEKVLEVGAGSGYAAAVLSRLAEKVFTVERIGELAKMAKENLRSAGIENVEVRHDDGSRGWPEAAPFDAILVSAGAEEVPKALLDQLAIGGRLVVPVNEDGSEQELVRITRESRIEFRQESLADVRFVPLIVGR
ncbi:MAG: protein-L-isoaspartate(D-aspartate) O-methyltransferase [Hyphomicrobiaceae bacterium]|nr:MAG: protein-L-isoaspartate(D-aspartate) O-methyltransferase [Hyphomicrobiaceae bacterium]